MRLFLRWESWESASWITPVWGRASILQIRDPQPLRVPRGQFLPRARCPPSKKISSWEQLSTQPEWGLRSCQNVHWLFSSSWLHSNSQSLAPSKRFRGCWTSWPQHWSSASSAIQLGLLHMRPLQYWLKPRVPPHAWRHGRLRIKVSQACVAALAPWKDHQWMEQGVPLGMVCIRKVVSTEASNLGWGVLCDVKPAFGPWKYWKYGWAFAPFCQTWGDITF